MAARVMACEEGGGASVVAHGDVSTVFQPADYDLDAVALAVERLVVWDGLLAVPLRGNAGGNAPLGERGGEGGCCRSGGRRSARPVYAPAPAHFAHRPRRDRPRILARGNYDRRVPAAWLVPEVRAPALSQALALVLTGLEEDLRRRLAKEFGRPIDAYITPRRAAPPGLRAARPAKRASPLPNAGE